MPQKQTNCLCKPAVPTLHTQAIEYLLENFLFHLNIFLKADIKKYWKSNPKCEALQKDSSRGGTYNSV